MDLGNLHPSPGSKRPIKRVGRGPGSGHGKTAGRGHKGKGARSGGNVKPGYEGGQMPLQRRLPKRGFKPIARTSYAIVNVGRLAAFDAGSTVDRAALRAQGLVGSRRGPIKILGEGTLDRALTVQAQAFSEKARAAIEGAGGTATVVE
jgi:large subunit ribosomal protein L15